MVYLFTILFLFFLVFLPIVIVKPSLLEKITKHAFTRKQAGLLVGGITLVFFILIGITAKPTVKSANQQKVEGLQTQNSESKASIVPANEIKTTATPATDSKTEGVLVTKVIDGDTIQVDIYGKNETLRLIGIDTPETVDPRKPVQCFGKEASAKAKSLLSNKSVRLEADPTQGERDKYQRLLRYVFLEDGTNFNKLMISEGYAHEYTYNTPYKYQLEFKQAQKDAEMNKLGLWADNACSTSTPQSTPTTIINGTTSDNNGNFTCAGKTTCGQMASCAEAQFYLNSCGVSRLDGDKDGVPCETLCN
ncbi:MAG: thermonuclease family protein [Candidatus Levybacteria bacterium]|nr:thermonuclease family protein [Candidatus Levybacteria bacterium]